MTMSDAVIFTITLISTLFLHLANKTDARFVFQAPSGSVSQSFGFTDTDETQLDLTHNINVFEITAPSSDSSPRRFKTQQYFQTLPIFGATLVIEQNQDQSQRPLLGHWYNHDDMMRYIPDTTPSITQEEALQIVFHRLNLTANDTYGNITNELCIYHTNRPYLAYNIQFLYVNTSQPNDAFQSMSIVGAFHPHKLLQHSYGSRSFKACGSGGNQKIGYYWYCGATNGMDITYTDTSSVPELVNDDFEVYDKGNRLWNSNNDDGLFQCKKTSTAQCNVDEFDSTVNGGYGTALDGYAFCVNTFAMYREWMAEAPVIWPKPFPVYVHVGENWVNANFIGDAINFGDGDGTSYHPLTSASITAHELAHGYTDRYSDLRYSQESGGMNEAYSDIAGESAEYYLRGSTDWINGYDITMADTGPPYDAFRYMKDPPLDTHSVGHWCDYYDEMNVHYSSGIYNKAAYLMSVDSTYSFSQQQIFRIFSTANKYWTKDSTMKEGVCGVLSALSDTYGNWNKYPQMETSVLESFNSVGLSCGGSHTDCGGFGIKCGSDPNAFCYYATMIPSTSGVVGVPVTIQAWPNNGARLYFYVYFTIQQFDCLNPRLIFKLDRLDYDGYYDGYDEMIEVYDNDMSLVQRCTAALFQCDMRDTCIDVVSVNNGATIPQGTTYRFTLIEGADVDAMCDDHDMTLNAMLKLRCAKATTVSPTPAPTNVPTNNPTSSPTTAPSLAPTSFPTLAPTTPPTMNPSLSPTNTPSVPSLPPTRAPSLSPTNKPTLPPTTAPTVAPSLSPTHYPTTSPSFAPSIAPSTNPSIAPTNAPTLAPSRSPIADPTESPTTDPTMVPSLDPTADPTIDPTFVPTIDPTVDPTSDPIAPPTTNPTVDPTLDPTLPPTEIPTLQPSTDPTAVPSPAPTTAPSGAPTCTPSTTPSQSPFMAPTTAPTLATHFPTVVPTLVPTDLPSINPSNIPTFSPFIPPSVSPTLSPTNRPSLTRTVVLTTQRQQRFQSEPDLIPTRIILIILASAAGLCISIGCVLLACAVCKRKLKQKARDPLKKAMKNEGSTPKEETSPKEERRSEEDNKHQLTVPQKGQKVKSYSNSRSPTPSPQLKPQKGNPNMDDIDMNDMALPQIAEAYKYHLAEEDRKDKLVSPKIVVTGSVRSTASRDSSNPEGSNVSGGRVAPAYLD